MKQSIRFLCIVAFAALALTFIVRSFTDSHAQSGAGSLPVDEFITQITATNRNSFVGGVGGDGRLVVIESTGDIATERTPNVRDANGQIIQRGRNNEDGNREIFLFDYAQRRVFQITNTRSALRTAAATPTPSPTATPTATPLPTPDAPEAIEVEVSNTRPTISNDGRFIAFTSNAANPANYDGNDAANRAALAADGNQEIFLYPVPAVAAADLTSGTEPAFVNLSGGGFTRVTDTPASARPRPGSAGVTPFVADDNRFPAVNDDASIIAFTSTRTNPALPNVNNADANPEIVVFNRTTNGFTQITDTPFNQAPNGRYNPIFNENPSVSGDGTTIAFVSNGNIQDSVANTSSNADNNAEVYVARLTAPGGAVRRTRQVTQTENLAPGVPTNFFNPGRHLSRDGQLLAFDSLARLEGDRTTQTVPGLYVVNLSNFDGGNLEFRQIGPRVSAEASTNVDISNFLTFPTFASETSAGGVTTNTLVFTSLLNFRANGGTPDAGNPGLNPPSGTNRFGAPQIFAANVIGDSFVSLTNFAASAGDLPQAFASNTRSRVVFSLAGVELGGGSLDPRAAEAYYLLTRTRPNADPTPTPAPGAVSFFTGTTERPVAAATASPTPTPSPVPADAPVAGLAPGMLAIARTTTAVVIGPNPGVSAQSLCQVNSECVSENRRPSLPIQLSGVSVSIGGAAAGLSFASANQINFVVPVGLAPALYNVVINNNGTLVRSQLRVVAAQPDIVSTTNGALGRARVVNATTRANSSPPPETAEPFNVTTPIIVGGQTQVVETDLRITLVGVRNVPRAAITVRIGSTALTGDAILDVRPTIMPGVDQITVRLPATLAGAGDVPVIVEVNTSGTIATSRPADTAPRVRIN